MSRLFHKIPLLSASSAQNNCRCPVVVVEEEKGSSGLLMRCQVRLGFLAFCCANARLENDAADPLRDLYGTSPLFTFIAPDVLHLLAPTAHDFPEQIKRMGVVNKF
jgi:hypothetical protein